MMNAIPNFDGMMCDDIYIYDWLSRIGWAGRISRIRSEDLVGDKRKGYTTIAGNIRNYAVSKYTAMRCRERGDIAVALLCERICDDIYKRLPADLRW